MQLHFDLQPADVVILPNDYFDFISIQRVTFPDSVAATLEADYQQKIVMNFELKDLSGNAVTAHQVIEHVCKHIGLLKITLIL